LITYIGILLSFHLYPGPPKPGKPGAPVLHSLGGGGYSIISSFPILSSFSFIPWPAVASAGAQSEGGWLLPPFFHHSIIPLFRLPTFHYSIKILAFFRTLGYHAFTLFGPGWCIAF
jgi:hypothetical protein